MPSFRMRTVLFVALLAWSPYTSYAASPTAKAPAPPPPPTDAAQIPGYVGANGKLSTPAGTGRFPAVVIMHGCGGPPGHAEWVTRLNRPARSSATTSSTTTRTKAFFDQRLK